MKCAAISERGKIREQNEDNYLILDKAEFDMVGVADGMGGHKSGDVASSLVVDIIKKYNFSSENLTQDIENCIKLANEEIFKKGKTDKEYQGMGTTLTLSIIRDKILTIGHVGDSRAYLLRNGKFKQLTNDHSFVGELVRRDLMSKEEAKDHPKKNLLTRALGTTEKVEVDIIELKLKVDDLLLLCSDGVTNMLSDSKLRNILLSNLGLRGKVQKLARLANQQGGHDNITAILYQSN